MPFCVRSLSSASAWAVVRGKPSKRKPCALGLLSSAALMISMTTSSGTSWPLSMMLFAASPNGVWPAISARSKSPVLRCFNPYLAISRSDCVPFPLPGGPNKMMLNIICTTYPCVVNKYSILKFDKKLLRKIIFCLITINTALFSLRSQSANWAPPSFGLINSVDPNNKINSMDTNNKTNNRSIRTPTLPQ